jgi:hypothetical protein
MKNHAMLWPVSVPPIDLNEVADHINDTARMELIKALVCSSGEGFDVTQLHSWLTTFIKENELAPQSAGNFEADLNQALNEGDGVYRP